MENAFRKLMVNFILWGVFLITYIIYYAIKNNLGLNGELPNSEITKFINYEVLIIMVVAAFIIFGLAALFTHKSKKHNEVESGKRIMNIALGEGSSIFFNFGSLNLLVTHFTSTYWPILITVICYIVGLYLYPSDEKL